MEASRIAARARLYGSAASGVRGAWRHAVELRAGLVCCAVVILWAAIPLGTIFTRAVVGGDVPTGAYGGFAMDQLQYLAWIREAGEHLLISNSFRVGDSDAVFLHPLFLASGMLWKLGLPIWLAWLFWAPVAIGTLIIGVLAYLRRLLPGRSQRTAAFILVFFLAPPVLPIFDLAGITLPMPEFDLMRVLGYQLHAGGSLWGYLPKALSIGLMALVFLAVEREFDAHRRRTSLLVATGVAALMVSWLHPWQGVTLCLALGGLLVWSRFQRGKLVVLPIIGAAALPLLYYFALSRTDADWTQAAVQASSGYSVSEWAIAIVGFSPFLLLAIRGVRRPSTVQDRLLVLWPIACFAALLVPSAGWYYAIAGASIPLAVLMVRGWESLSLGPIRSRGLEPAVVVGLIALVVLPGSAYLIDSLKNRVRNQWYTYYSSPSDDRALDFLNAYPEEGAVFATPGYGSLVPALTGRHVWSGHFAWTPNFWDRETAAKLMVNGRLRPRAVRATLAGSGAKFFLADCRYPPAVVRQTLGGAVTPLRTFGCAGVYRITAAQ